MSAQADSSAMDDSGPPCRRPLNDVPGEPGAPCRRPLSGLASTWWPAVDRAMDWAGDRLNPILVKETRQALKSKQFTITFGLLLICGWVWSILGVALIGSRIWYSAHGAEMFFGYYIILAFPLLVIVPFGAFRSLAVEQEDRTYELMSITTLGPRQIVRGKLGSAVLQMLVYLSAISPCLAFTYMLRGIDFPTILFFLFYTVLASLGLAVAGLLIGTLTQERHWQVVLSVLLIAGLLFCLLMSFYLVGATLAMLNVAFTEPEFWQVNGALLTAYVSYFVLVFYAAAAQLTFASDNRSTRLRVTMLIQHVLFVGWMAWTWIWPAEGEYAMLMIFMSFVGIHWYVMGALMTGESPQLSPRVKRRLPQSFLGRAFLTWLNPGPGTGYVLAVSSLLGALVMVLAAVVTAEATVNLTGGNLTGWRSNHIGEVLAFGVLGLSYIVIYLGLGLLLVRLLRRFTHVGILLSVLIQILMVLLGAGVPLIVHMMTWPRSDYSLLQITNPFWSLERVGNSSSIPPEGYVLLVVVPMTALIVFMLNLPGVAREVRQVRVPKPKRVAEEDAELTAKRAPPQPVRASPWD